MLASPCASNKCLLATAVIDSISPIINKGPLGVRSLIILKT